MYRFEGINQKFTKKLYEWESRKGIAPECSTITLLQSGMSGPNNNNKEEKHENIHQNTIDIDSSQENLSRSSPDLVSTQSPVMRKGGGVSVARTDSVKTQSSLKLIHEKMSLLANLQVKADQCPSSSLSENSNACKFSHKCATTTVLM